MARDAAAAIQPQQEGVGAMNITWPNGKRVAVLVSLLLESWSEGYAPTYFPRTTPLRAGSVDLPARVWSQYGGEEGLWRLLKLLSDENIPATVFANALSAEKYPDLVREILRRGQHIAGHGYAQNEYLCEMSDDKQRIAIRKSLDTIKKVSGTLPTGWVTPVYSWNAQTANLLVQEGIKWHADALNTSLPRHQKTTSGPIVALPWSDFVDNRVRGNPAEFVDTYINAFDYLYSRERLGLLNIAFHSHFGGRPVMAANFAKVLCHLSGFKDVWFVRHEELADWFQALGVDSISPAEQFA
jgi:peptidoglycan/xylan/chitin deacetylase (PgdA/CDA1 family)